MSICHRCGQNEAVKEGYVGYRYVCAECITEILYGTKNNKKPKGNKTLTDYK